ncbi:MAG: hypothetical protein OXQ89_08270, partial [Rhodospirillaceae bacterium]|nr:hypothetical protein [Rhodospirillaceae bacterium]
MANFRHAIAQVVFAPRVHGGFRTFGRLLRGNGLHDGAGGLLRAATDVRAIRISAGRGFGGSVAR